MKNSAYMLESSARCPVAKATVHCRLIIVPDDDAPRSAESYNEAAVTQVIEEFNAVERPLHSRQLAIDVIDLDALKTPDPVAAN